MTELVKITSSELSTELAEILATEKDIIAAAISPATRRSYAMQWRMFAGFCAKYGLPPLPSTAETISQYIAYCVKAKKSAAYIDQALAAIKAAHKRAGVESPTSAELVRVSAKGARRSLGTAPYKKAAATVDIIRAMVDSLDRSTLQGKRDAALLLVGFSGAFRRSELVALDIADLEKTTTKDGKAAYIIHIRHSKTDQEGKGLLKAIFPTKSKAMNPVAALEDYLASAQITDGAIFRRIRRGDHITGERLTGRSVALVVKAAAGRAEITLDLAGHSLRSGFITSALAAGESERAVMNQSGHRSVTVMRGYQQRANALQDNAAAGLAGLM